MITVMENTKGHFFRIIQFSLKDNSLLKVKTRMYCGLIANVELKCTSIKSRRMKWKYTTEGSYAIILEGV